MFRNQYDNDVTTRSPQGRLHQVEYAMEAVKQESATIGLKNSTHGSLLALALKNQLVLFDLLINIRIKMQKSCIKVKTMHRENFSDGDDSKDAKTRMGQEIQALLDSFLNLHKLIKDQAIPIQKDNSEDKLDAEHKNMLSVINGIIVEWWSKVQVDSKAIKDNKDILEQINYILSNRERLIQKTRVDRSDGCMADETKTDKEIYDDDDFYGQMLRQLIESKASINSFDPVTLNKQWLEIQKIRRKMKRKIDTRASKGRTIRYKIHQPLISFMAPVEGETYEDSAKDTLFASLFSQRKVQEN